RWSRSSLPWRASLCCRAGCPSRAEAAAAAPRANEGLKNCRRRIREPSGSRPFLFSLLVAFQVELVLQLQGLVQDYARDDQDQAREGEGGPWDGDPCVRGRDRV